FYLSSSLFPIQPRIILSTLFPYTTLFRSDFWPSTVGCNLHVFIDENRRRKGRNDIAFDAEPLVRVIHDSSINPHGVGIEGRRSEDRKSTRLNSSHQIISYAVFCLKKKKKK